MSGRRHFETKISAISLFWVGLAIAFIISIFDIAHVYWIQFKVCTPTLPADYERFSKTIAALDSVVDAGTKLSAALVAFGVTILVGVQSHIKLSRLGTFFVPIALIAFLVSALLGMWWRLGVGEIWLNSCLSLIADPMLTTRYDHQLYFFLIGLVASGFVVIDLALARARTT